jgi:transcriptional regulator of acetoin/glycerol metabolism
MAGKVRPAPADCSDQREQLIEALRASGGNKSQAARTLGVSRLTVLNRMRKYGIDLAKVIRT